MLSVIWTPRARRNLTAILDYIAARGANAASSFLRLLREHVQRLSDYPNIYREGRLIGTREMVVHPNYVVIYRVSKKAVEIVAIVHSRRETR